MSDIFGDEGAEFEQEVTRDVEPEPMWEETPEPIREEKPVINEDAKVPLAALNESRAQLRQTQAELNAIRQQVQQFESLRQELEQARAQARQQQEEQQFNADPLGMLQKQMRELSEKVTQPQPQVQQYQEQQLFTSIASQVQEFKKTTPDYDDALQHVLEARKNELMTMGATEFDAQQRVAQEAQEIAINSLRAGQNPGQVVYQLAKLRGYTAKQISQKLETVAKGQAASTSLSKASGGTDRGELSLAEIENMDDGEFDKFWKNFEKSQRGSRANH